MLIKEGVNPPFGYGLVRHRPDYMGFEIAPMPFNWLIRFVYWLQRKSYKDISEAELRTLEIVKELLELRGERKYNDGYQKGYSEGEAHAARVLSLWIEQQSKVKN